MYKNIVFALSGCLLAFVGFAQSPSIESILKRVEQNNQELKAMSEYVESKRLELKSGNNLPDPQLGAYYLPFGEHNRGDYTEFQISQSFEFPTVYSARGSLIDQQSAQLELEYQVKRQGILAEAKNYCLNLIYLNKRMDTETLRVEQARQVFDQVQELYEKEQVGILELNKARVAWMQEQFKIQQIESDVKNTLLQLNNLNGGNELSFTQDEYSESLVLAAKDALWQEKQVIDPVLTQLKQQEAIAQQSLSLAKNKSFPNLTAGYNSQGVAGERFSGIYAGVTIPLWSNRNKVKAAQSQLEFQQSFNSSKTLQAHTSFEKQYNAYEIMLSKFQDYEATLSGLNSDKLLLQSYLLGELSFIEYYMELQFYRQAYDAMLDMQYQLYISQNQLLKHQL
ncbi:TolC family protein [Cyclobacterium plantarum]|uniref:TolC family protein n=1 Tax=Cyclobacterium plantarum TaxID=2716263 RepID=A0ABX0H4B5_9BACT|nr:TolC family protein [Cyclobacterium plantarum]NHE56469.1 TolC family protein [Cyclobacterium plantarum]